MAGANPTSANLTTTKDNHGDTTSIVDFVPKHPNNNNNLPAVTSQHPTPIDTGNMLDLSRQNTEIKRDLEEGDNNEAKAAAEGGMEDEED